MDLEIGRVVERLIIALCIPVLLVIGYKLLVLGVSGDMQITAGMPSFTAKVTRVTPGALCFILAITLGAYCLFSKLSIKSDKTETTTQSIQRQSPNTQTTAPPPAKHEGPVSADIKAAAGRSAQTTSTTTQTETMAGTIEYLGPNTTQHQLPLSYRIRFALSDLYLCSFSHAQLNDPSCMSEYQKIFLRLPTSEEVKAIEAAERDMSSNQVQLQVKGNKAYIALREAFEK